MKDLKTRNEIDDIYKWRLEDMFETAEEWQKAADEAESEIVKKQLKNEDINVFSNKRFDDDSKEAGLDFQDMISIDTKLLSEAFGGNVNQDDFLNTAVEVSTLLEPNDLTIREIDELIELDIKDRALKQEAEAIRADRNKYSKQIGMLMGQGKREEAEEMKKKVGVNKC